MVRDRARRRSQGFLSWPGLVLRRVEESPIARHFFGRGLYVFRAIEAKGAVAEGRIDKRAMMRGLRLSDAHSAGNICR